VPIRRVEARSVKRLLLQAIFILLVLVLAVLDASFHYGFYYRPLARIVMANQSAARQDLRALRDAQMYQWYSTRTFADPECLANLSDCLPDYEGGPFLDGAVAMLGVKDGYRRWFVPGPKWTEAAWRDEVNRSGEPLDPDRLPDGYQDFVYIAVPEYPGLTGEIGYCISPGGNGEVLQYYPNHIFYSWEQINIDMADEDELHLLFSFSSSSGPRSTEPPFDLRWGWDACPWAPSQEWGCGPRTRGFCE